MLLPLGARAQEHRVSAGVTSVSYGSFFRGTGDQWAADLGWAMTPAFLPDGMEVGAGLRATTGRTGVTLPLEVYGALRFVARIGPWQPAAGPELGLSGLARFSPRTDGFPGDLDQMEGQRLSPLYVSFGAAPLRFRFGRWTLSALELGLGAPLFPSGTALRTQLGFVSFGGSL